MNIRDLPVRLQCGPDCDYGIVLPPVDGDEITLTFRTVLKAVLRDDVEIGLLAAPGSVQHVGPVKYRQSDCPKVEVRDDGTMVRVFSAIGWWNSDGEWEN